MVLFPDDAVAGVGMVERNGIIQFVDRDMREREHKTIWICCLKSPSHSTQGATASTPGSFTIHPASNQRRKATWGNVLIPFNLSILITDLIED